MTKTEVRKKAKRELELALKMMYYRLAGDETLTCEESNQVAKVLSGYANAIADHYKLNKDNI